MIGGRLLGLASLASVVALVVAGCLTDAPVATPEPTPTPRPEATPIVTRYPLNTRVWYGGLILTFGTATATIDEKGGPVAIDLTLENTGGVEAGLDGPVRLKAGETSLEPTRETVLPLVPAATTVATTVTFEVGEGFDPATATIELGRTIEHQGIVPLVSGATAAVTLEPLGFEVSVEGQAGSIFIKVHSAELRADLPDWGLELPRDVLALTLSYDATFRSDFPGGAAFTTENVRLVLPGGERVGPRPDGHSHSIALLRPNRRNTILTRFEVPAPGSGNYTFVVGDGATTVDLPFAIQVP